MTLEDQAKRTPFEIRYHHRYELRGWLQENFPFLRRKNFLDYSDEDRSLLEERAGEIVQACIVVESIDLRARSAYVDYYKNDWKTIKTAYVKKDYKTLSDALGELLSAIDVE